MATRLWNPQQSFSYKLLYEHFSDSYKNLRWPIHWACMRSYIYYNIVRFYLHNSNQDVRNLLKYTKNIMIRMEYSRYPASVTEKISKKCNRDGFVTEAGIFRKLNIFPILYAKRCFFMFFSSQRLFVLLKNGNLCWIVQEFPF